MIIERRGDASAPRLASCGQRPCAFCVTQAKIYKKSFFEEDWNRLSGPKLPDHLNSMIKMCKCEQRYEVLPTNEIAAGRQG